MKKIKVEFDITGCTELNCETCVYLIIGYNTPGGYYPECLIFNKALDKDKILHDSRGVYKPLRCDECIKNEVE